MTSTDGQKVSFPSDNPAGDGMGAMFGTPATHPLGLIVLPDWWGLNEQIQRQADEMARNGGFTVLVLDVYRGKVAKDRETAGHYAADLNWSGALNDVSGGAQYLESKGCKAVGITGFCLGGALSFVAASVCPEVLAAAPFYGIPPEGTGYRDSLIAIKTPVQAHFGKLDDKEGFSDLPTVRVVQELLDNAGVTSVQWYLYDAGHAFCNPTMPMYHKETCEIATRRMYEFMRQELGK